MKRGKGEKKGKGRKLEGSAPFRKFLDSSSVSQQVNQLCLYYILFISLHFIWSHVLYCFATFVLHKYDAMCLLTIASYRLGHVPRA